MVVASLGAGESRRNATKNVGASRGGFGGGRLAGDFAIKANRWSGSGPVSSTATADVPDAGVLVAGHLHGQLLIEAEWLGLLAWADVACATTAAEVGTIAGSRGSIRLCGADLVEWCGGGVGLDGGGLVHVSCAAAASADIGIWAGGWSRLDDRVTHFECVRLIKNIDSIDI